VAISLDIPLQTLTAGPHTFGPVSVPDGLMLATLTIDRTATRPNADGLNLQPATTTIDLAIWQSNDGGTTWLFRAGAGLVGGTYPSNDAGDPYTFSNVSVELLPGSGRRARADVTVAGAQRVAVAGSLAVV
jgi:hypothetical protein